MKRAAMQERQLRVPLDLNGRTKKVHLLYMCDSLPDHAAEARFPADEGNRVSLTQTQASEGIVNPVPE
jgi:hypothetical protein